MLAAGTVALWKAETALYSPLLVEHLPGAPLLAGMTLHHLYGQRLHPWLKAGASGLHPLQQWATQLPAQCMTPTVLSALKGRVGRRKVQLPRKDEASASAWVPIHAHTTSRARPAS